MKKNRALPERKLILSILLFFITTLSLKSQLTVQTFSYTGAIQNFTVPTCVYSMTIQAKGAQGGYNTASVYMSGLGADIKGVISVTPGQVLKILVGQQPSATGGNGGGGGSFVTDILNNPLIIAGGGGGSSGQADSPNKEGQVGTAGGQGAAGGTGVGGLGGTAGNGGAIGSNTSWTSAGGGGLLTDGASGSTGTGSGGKAFVNGGAASVGNSIGGFGGGGSGSLNFVGGGGGGYSGGGGGANDGGVGGGGGSFNSGTNQVNSGGSNTGNGVVIFSFTPGSAITAFSTPSAICTGGTSTLTASGVMSYTWLPGNANTTTITVSPTSNANYTVLGTNSTGCTTSMIVTVPVDMTVPSLSVANTSSATGGICPTKTVILTASGASGYTWTGGSSPITNGVVFSPTIAADYTVTGANACGTSTAVTSVSVHPFPTITPVASTPTLCSGSSLTLTGVGNSTAYVWSGGTIPITDGVGFSPVLTNTYTVIGTSALSCTASATVPVTVVTTPVTPPIASPALICIGKSSTISAQGATNYTIASATQTVFTNTLVATPTSSGTTSYTITKSNANCVNTQIISVVTNSLPTVIAIVTPTLVCALNPATLAVAGGISYTWTSPGPPSFSFTGASPVVTPPVPTTYTVAASDGTCINTTTVFLATNPNPTITVSATSSMICNGQSVTVNANGGINYTWTATTGTFYTQSVTDSPTTAVAYNVVGDNSFNCTSGNTQIVLVNPNPTITIAATKTLVCSSGPSTLTASGANTFTWDANANGALTPGTIVHPINTTSGPVVYTVTGTYSATGCQSTKTVQVTVFVPTISIAGNTNTCYGGNVSFTATGGNNGSYSWNTGVGNPYTFPVLTTSITAPGVFTVSASTTSISVNCPGSQTVAVGIYYNPTITAVAQRTTICKNESVELTGNGGVSYVWSNNMATPSITVSPVGIVANYTVTGTDANGCVGTGTVQVKISGCTGINELSNVSQGFNIYPNPSNGEFTIQSTADVTLNLVNELGQLVKIINLAGSNNYKASVTGLARGIYFISGQKDNVQINQKIVVTK